MPRRASSGPILATLGAVGLIALQLSEAAAFPPSPAGGRCGGFAGFRCEPGLTCRLPSRRGNDMMGVCVPMGSPGPRPGTGACPRIYRPVCGRDGRTYGNDCELRRSGVPMRHPGRCRGG